MIATIPLDRLDAHPGNCNVMPDDLLDKLASHVARTGRCPPLIVRPREGGRYQLLDGHHRAQVLRRLGRTEAPCVVWEVDDAEALVLLTTLNRLSGADDPRRRGALVEELAALRGESVEALAALLPEDAGQLQRLAALNAPPRVTPPGDLPPLPVAIHFFVTPAQKRAIEAALAATGLGREPALIRLLNLETSP